MTHKNNKDILDWKRAITNLQENGAPVEPTINEDKTIAIQQEEQALINSEEYKVVVSASDMGIIVDVKDKNDNEIDSNQYWDEDVMEGKVDEDLEDIGNAIKKGFNKVKDFATTPIKTHTQKYGFKRPWLSVDLDNKIRSKVPGWNKGGAPLRSKPLEEGTWSIPETPEQVKKLSNLLKNPLDAETALDELYDVFGDDQLFDDLEVMKREEPETDVRHVVISRLKDMNFIKEVRENNQSQKVDEEYANEQHEQLEYIHHVLQECGDGNVDNAMVDQAIAFVEDIREQHFDDEGDTKSESVTEDEEEKSYNTLDYLANNTDDMAQAMGMTQDEFWELVERVGVDQYGELTKENFDDVVQHIVDNQKRYRQIHIFRKAGEFDEA